MWPVFTKLWCGHVFCLWCARSSCSGFEVTLQVIIVSLISIMEINVSSIDNLTCDVTPKPTQDARRMPKRPVLVKAWCHRSHCLEIVWDSGITGWCRKKVVIFFTAMEFFEKKNVSIEIWLFATCCHFCQPYWNGGGGVQLITNHNNNN